MKPTIEQVQAMCDAVQLDIPVERRERLAENLGAFYTSFAPVWEFDLELYEPPTIVPRPEAEAHNDSER